MFRKVSNLNWYDADAEEERQKQALLRHINRMREQKPGLRPTAWQAFLFFTKILIGAALFYLALFWRAVPLYH